MGAAIDPSRKSRIKCVRASPLDVGRPVARVEDDAAGIAQGRLELRGIDEVPVPAESLTGRTWEGDAH